ncbi:MAG: AsnC family transcriptional regulator [Chloroflexota bacterium]|nr:AsnC family transcriptional regulator [Chloroflexota bacterium]
MTERKLDHTDRSLLNLVQSRFPLSRRPFAELGANLGLDETEVIERIDRLKQALVIRYIGPVLDSWSLGYRTTLVAMRVAEEGLERAARIVNQHPGVSHNYSRNDALNLWFTLAVPPGDDLKHEVQELANRVKPEEVVNMPAVRVFKRGVFFDLVGDGCIVASPPANPRPALRPAPALSPCEMDIVRALQQDIPLTSRPFDDMARDAGVGVDEFLICCRALNERGVMPRFGASIRHHCVGFAANALICWRVPLLMVEEAGETMSAFSEVSHCFEREASERWPYNIFAMVHARTRDDCRQTVGSIAARIGIEEYKTLFTTREFKKERVRIAARNEGQA